MLIGWIILGVCVAAFVGLGTYGLVRYLRGRDRYEWPAGQRTVGEYADTRVHLIAPRGLDLGLPREDVAHLCALAASCVGQVSDVRIAQACVHVLPDVDYERVYDAPHGTSSNGMLLKLNTETGVHGMPLVACRLSAWPSTLTTGSLVVHELTHYAQDLVDGDPPDYGHDSSMWWLPATDSIEARARALFMALRGRAG